MPLNLEDKRAIVASVNAVATEALSAVVADYRGLTVSQMTELRSKARETGVYLKVVRNTLAKFAVKDTEFECLNDALGWPHCFGFFPRMIRALLLASSRISPKTMTRWK